MLSAVIIDDEYKGRLALKQKILDYCKDIMIIGEAADGKEGLELINEKKPDIVFLDIEMPLVNGFEMLQNLKERNFHLIFTTAYNHYAIKAIKYSAFDYLLKPIDIEELKTTSQKLITTAKSNIDLQIELLQGNFQDKNRPLKKLAIPTIDGICFYDLKDLIYLEADSNYTNLYFVENKKIVASKTLKEFQDLLPDDHFYRPHNSYIINLSYVSKYIKGDGGQIQLLNGSLVDVSRKHKDEFLKLINKR